jgi:hypothetical protein
MKIPAVISMGSEEWLKQSVAGTGKYSVTMAAFFLSFLHLKPTFSFSQN